MHPSVADRRPIHNAARAAVSETCSPVWRRLVGDKGLCSLLAVVLRVLDQGRVLRDTVPTAVALLLGDHERGRALKGWALNVLAWVRDAAWMRSAGRQRQGQRGRAQ